MVHVYRSKEQLPAFTKVMACISVVAVVVINANGKAIIVTLHSTTWPGHCCCCCHFADTRAAIVTDTAMTHALIKWALLLLFADRKAEIIGAAALCIL